MSEWKCGNEFLPYHPSASHVNPDHRDGWNACYYAAIKAGASGAAQDAKRYRAFNDAGLPITFMGVDYFDKASLDAAIDEAVEAQQRGSGT